MSDADSPIGVEGPQPLELRLEPLGQDYWLESGETVHVTSYGTWKDQSFVTVHQPGCLTVWATSWFAAVSHPDGTEFPPGPSAGGHSTKSPST